jgi:CDP-6-deoxy-D-xylo-4-hexulose-3-dehydrase
VVGSLSQTDIVMNQVFWIGVYPGIQGQILDYMLETMKALPESVGAVAS